MPALQVRDFPEDIYEKLRICAQRNHRSMAQQTIVAVEQMLQQEEQGRRAGENATSIHPSIKHETFDTEEERLARIKKRKDIFAQIKASKVEISPDFPSPEELVRQGREERSLELERNMPQLLKGCSE